MMRRALELEAPRTIPRHLRRGLTGSEIEEYEAEYRKKPGLMFFEYPLAAEVDRDLYRDLRRWWKSSPRDQIQVAHDLAIEYGTATGPLQGMILQCLEGIDDRAIDLPDRAQTLEPVWFRILDQSSADQARFETLDRIAGLRVLSEEGFSRIMGMASREGVEPTSRARAIGILAGPWQPPGPPRNVDKYLLEVAARDPCDECRMSAVTEYVGKRTPRDEVIPAYTAALTDAVRLDDARIVSRLIRVLSVDLRIMDAAPALAIALQSSKPSIRASAVNGFEKIAGIPAGEAQKYTGLGVGMMLLDKGSNDNHYMAELDWAVGVWSRWWAERGGELLRQGKREAFEAEARHLYERARNARPGG